MNTYLTIGYLLGIAAWIAIGGTAIVWLLRLRRLRVADGKKVRWIHAGLSLWLLLALLTVVELYFALFFSASDAFNMTNVSKRWFRQYIDAQRNDDGYRDSQEFTKRVPRGVRRIFFLGDSFTVGHGIENMADRFSDIVGAKLESAHPKKFIVGNIADPGNDITLVEANIKGLILGNYDVDMIVYVVTLNDIEFYDERTAQVQKNIDSYQPQFFLFSETYFFNWLYFRFQQVNRPEVRNYYEHLKDSYQGRAWEGMRRKLDSIRNLCRSNDIELRFVIFPFVHNIGPDYSFRNAHKKLVEYCQKNAIPVLDLEPVLAKHADENLTVNRFDAHPNERAHSIAAKAIRTQLLGDLFEVQPD